MTPTRNGKIAHLPLALRNELNHRLDNGVPGRELIAWLNADPEVQRILVEYFQGYRITQQNLSQWRCGGYQDWVQLQDTRHLTLELAKDPENIAPETDSPKIVNALTRITTVEFMMAYQNRLRDCSNTEQRWKHVCDLTTRLSNLRRDQHRADCLAFEQAKHDYEAATAQRAAKQAVETEARRQLLASFLPQRPKPSPAIPQVPDASPQTQSFPHGSQLTAKNTQFPSATHPNAMKLFPSPPRRADLPPIIGIRHNIGSHTNNLRGTPCAVPPSHPLIQKSIKPATPRSRITCHPLLPFCLLSRPTPPTCTWKSRPHRCFFQLIASQNHAKIP